MALRLPMKLHFLWLCWGPVMLGYSIGWAISRRSDWAGCAIIASVGLVYGVVTYVLAFRLLRRSGGGDLSLVGGMIAGPLLGVVLALMLILHILD